MSGYLFFCIVFYEPRGYIFGNINQLTIKSMSDKCNMTYENYINHSMSALELRINCLIARNPQLIKLLIEIRIIFL